MGTYVFPGNVACRHHARAVLRVLGGHRRSQEPLTTRSVAKHEGGRHRILEWDHVDDVAGEALCLVNRRLIPTLLQAGIHVATRKYFTQLGTSRTTAGAGSSWEVLEPYETKWGCSFSQMVWAPRSLAEDVSSSQTLTYTCI